MDVASFLNEIGQELAKRGTKSRELAALDFEAEGRDISVRVRSGLHPHWYPALDVILDKIGRTCRQQGIVVAQLRRIAFQDSQITVELVQEAGRPAKKVYAYPIEGTLGSPEPDFRAAAD